MTVFFPVDNARTMDFNANDVGYIPSNAPHYVENTGETDLVFLEMFAASEFMDVSLSQWIKQLPPRMVTEHLNFSKELIEKIPSGKRVIV
jgi:oxalate decarboxylase